MSATATGAPDRPFWADGFDMDLARVFPEAREMLRDLADVELVTTGAPCPRTGRLNHASVWNGRHAMLAYYGLEAPVRPASLVAGNAAEIRCTAWEAFRDAWPHQYLMIVELRPVWNTQRLWPQFETLMWAERKWGVADADKVAAARAEVLMSITQAAAELREIVEARPGRVRRVATGEAA
jgi:hypothetical protein